MKTTVAEYNEFMMDDNQWKGLEFSDCGQAMFLDHSEIDDKFIGKKGEILLDPSTKILTPDSFIIHSIGEPSLFNFGEDGIHFDSFFRTWKNMRKLQTIVISIPKENVDKFMDLTKDLKIKVIK